MKKILAPLMLTLLLITTSCNKPATQNPVTNTAATNGQWTINGVTYGAWVDSSPSPGELNFICDSNGGQVGGFNIWFKPHTTPTVSGVYPIASGSTYANFGITIGGHNGSFSGAFGSDYRTGQSMTVNVNSSTGKITVTIPPLWIYGDNGTPATDSVLVSASLSYP